jgi:hypothetical protein
MLVKQSTGFDLIPINCSNSSDKILIDTLDKILKKFLKTSTSTHFRYEGRRINEVGRRIEETVVNEMNKPPVLIVRRLGKSGYPDIEISHSQHITYLEVKTSSIKEEVDYSSFRYFYYSNVNKIKSNAMHLLLNITVTQESPGYWKVDKYDLHDLSTLSLSLKNEFNASKKDLMDEKSIIISGAN